MSAPRARVGDAIAGLLQVNAFWSRGDVVRALAAHAGDPAGLDFYRGQARWLREQLPQCAPVWIAPPIGALLSAAGAVYPDAATGDRADWSFPAAWLWFAEPLPIPDHDPVRAILVRTIQVPGRGTGYVPGELVPVSRADAATALSLWYFLDLPLQRPLPWFSGIAIIEHGQPVYAAAETLRNYATTQTAGASFAAAAVRDRAIIGIVSAFLRFVAQRVVVETRERLQHGGEIKRLRRDGWREEPVVRVIQLRASEPTGAHGEAGREYHARWLVRGHWRNQAHGPGRTRRRPVWIDSYVKGPDDAPLKQPQWTAYKVAR